MYAIEERYYKINRVLLKILGLWPYQQSYFTQIRKALFVGLLFTSILVQLLVFVTMQCSINLLLRIFSIVFPILFVTVKYCLFIIQADSVNLQYLLKSFVVTFKQYELHLNCWRIWNEQVKKMLERMREDWRLLKDKLEFDILEKYFYSMQFVSIILIVVGIFCFFLLVMLQLLPLFLDVILPLNDSRPLRIFIIAEYFLNPEKYYYIILLHEILVYFIALITLYGTFITIMTYMWHACALFKIASYRIENAIGKNALATSIFGRHYLFDRRIVHAVLIHRKAVKFTKLFTFHFTVLFAILICIGVISLSINLFQLTLINDSNFEDTALFIVLISLHLSYMFIGNYGGQRVTDHGMEFFEATYNGLWYTAPLHTQKLLLFIMQKKDLNGTLVLGRLYAISLESFASLTNAAVSYFLVMYSTRK